MRNKQVSAEIALAVAVIVSPFRSVPAASTLVPPRPR